MFKLIALLAVVLLGSVVAALAWAPYLPQLVIEGVPPLTWPGPGHFAEIAGTAEPRELGGAEDTALPTDLARIFTSTGSKAFLVYRNGRLALEHYAEGVSAETRFNSFSMAKSLVGALIYKALAERRIASLDTTLGELLPRDRGLAHVTLRSLLAMRTGISFDGGEGKFGGTSAGKDVDTSPNPFGPLARLHFLGLSAVEPDLVSTGATDAPFSYQNVNTALLGEVLETVYQRPLNELAADKLWLPAGASPASWRQPAARASVSAYCCIYATARDWIRVGLFLAGNGTWAEPFLPERLWREYLGLDVGYADRLHDNYGAHIRQNVLDRKGQDLQGPFTYLVGQGGQLLYLMPERGLVVYRAGEDWPLLHSTLYAAWNATSSD